MSSRSRGRLHAGSRNFRPGSLIAALAFRPILALAEKAGLSVTRSANTLKKKRLEVLVGLGIDTVLDIGANTGQYAAELRKGGYLGRIISFEPAPSPFRDLEARAKLDSRHDCVHIGLGSHDSEGELLITEDSPQCSFRPPSRSSTGIKVKSRTTVPVRRLDSVLPEMTTHGDRFYMKIDTQGSEREVLLGAHEVLEQTDAVELELSLVELYEGQILLPDLWKMLTDFGFRPAWLQRGYRDSIWLLQADGLFVREPAWKAKRKLEERSRTIFGRP